MIAHGMQVELASLDYKASRLVRSLDAVSGQRGGFGEGGLTEVVSARCARAPHPAHLEREGALLCLVIVAATLSDPAPLRSGAPYSGRTTGEYITNVAKASHPKHCAITKC